MSAMSFNAVYSHVSGAITLSSLTAAQIATNPPTASPARFPTTRPSCFPRNIPQVHSSSYGGYEYYVFADPRDPLTAPYTDYNGYLVSVVTNNAYLYHQKIMQLGWTGLKYAYDDHIDISAGYYLLAQNSYGKTHCWTRWPPAAAAPKTPSARSQNIISTSGSRPMRA